MYIPLQIVKSTLLLLCLFQTVIVNAQEEKSETQDTSAQLKLPPVTQNFISFYTSSQLEFAIDPDSVSIPADKENEKNKDNEYEVRYTLKATSKQGAVNISYEGIRCDKHQKIIYAIWRSDGSWTRVRSPAWSPINKTGNNIQHSALAESFFCSGNTLSGSLPSIVNRIKLNRPLNYY